MRANAAVRVFGRDAITGVEARQHPATHTRDKASHVLQRALHRGEGARQFIYVQQMAMHHRRARDSAAGNALASRAFQVPCSSLVLRAQPEYRPMDV